MLRPAFSSPLPLRLPAPPHAPSPHRVQIHAKAKKSKRAKKPARRPKPPSPPPGPAAARQAFPGPLAPDLLSDDPTPGPDASPRPADAPSADGLLPVVDAPRPAEALDDAGDEPDADPDALPVADESRLKLPDLGAVSSVRRKRKPRAAPAPPPPPEEPAGDAPLSTDAIRRLTAAYRAGGEGAQPLIDEIEKNPDYMFQTGNPRGEYDLTSAIIGSGRPSKEGLYFLPYLQSGHLLLLAVVLVVAFVYYPGFPLTEADDGVREALKRGLALVGVLNAVLAVFAFRSARKRGQPAAFWAFKTAVLGDLAFGELRRNAPLVEDADKRDGEEI